MKVRLTPVPLPVVFCDMTRAVPEIDVTVVPGTMFVPETYCPTPIPVLLPDSVMDVVVPDHVPFWDVPG